jgi:AbrB family looped-hinge helix DNA binding protein
MKLQKQLSRKVGKIKYPKWVVTIPTKIIEEIDWKAGENLEAVIQDGKVILKPKKITS